MHDIIRQRRRTLKNTFINCPEKIFLKCNHFLYVPVWNRSADWPAKSCYSNSEAVFPVSGLSYLSKKIIEIQHDECVESI